MLILLSIILCSCSSYYTSNGEKYYLSSRNGENLVVPPGLTEDNISHFHDLPEQTQNPQVSIEPPTV
ncbi:hypothetical protein [Legionella adelaidensis]|uniref:hypothetical protein n=1 Tax=Legionella adelaidensis TaxID=45056 RepID=UPI003898FA26